MPSEKELNSYELSTIYKIRLIVSESEKENYTKDEVLQMLDQIALAKKV